MNLSPTPLHNTSDERIHLKVIARLERLLSQNPNASLPRTLLGKESLWKKLAPELALRWATLAQVAGLFDLSREVLEWTHETYPDYLPSWQAHLDLLLSLGLEAEAAELARRQPQALAPEGAGTLRGERLKPGQRVESRARESELDAPFERLRREEEEISRFLALFRGREDCFARQWVDRENSSQGYVPVRRTLEAADVKDHLRGSRTYGIYLLQKDSRVRLAVIDADLAAKFRSGTLRAQDRDTLRREKGYLLDRLPEIAQKSSMETLVEFSGGKGFHFWFFFHEPIPAATARSVLQKLVRRIEPDLSCFTLEVFPKQDQLAGKGLGNLVKLPLGVHRATGKRSFFIHIADRSVESQLACLERVKLIPSDRLSTPDSPAIAGQVVTHPVHHARGEVYPELEALSEGCAAIGQILSGCRRSRELSVREEKILLGTLGFLPRGRTLLHQVLQELPDYNPHLVDYKLSRLRGTPLGCRRIHSLLNLVRDLCAFPRAGDYPHPLLHCAEWSENSGVARSERCANLDDALENLKVAIGVVQRFLQPARSQA